jgi:nicotinamide-nucleotide amidase
VNAEVITIGTELLLGHILDTNSLYLSRRLAEIGVNLYYKTSVGDNTGRIKAALEIAASRADIIIITGGLGPTVDDITRDAVSLFTGKKLVSDAETMKKIEAYFKDRSIKMPGNNRVQADIPEGAVIIENKNGMAPGFIVSHNNKLIAAMPGVPSEMHPMMENTVMPYIIQKYGTGKVIIKSHTLKVVGLGESLVDEKINDLFKTSENPTIGVYAHHTEIEVRLTAKADSAKDADFLNDSLKKKIYERLGENIYGEDDESLENLAGAQLINKKMTLSTAESCTAGLLSFRLTNVAGSSAYFMGGISSYSNDVKKALLGVPETILEKHGSVSPECAEAMSIACRGKFDTDCAVSITGIAGPGGGTAEKPVGLVYIAVNIKGKVEVFKNNFGGSRDVIRARSAHMALYYFLRSIKG